MAVTNRPRFAAIGDNCIDAYISLEQGGIGGNALNVAIRWALLGAASEYLGAVGNDLAGARIRQALAQMGVAAAHLRTVAEPTGVTRIALTEDGERILLQEDFGSSASYEPSANDLASLVGCSWVHCVTLPRRQTTVATLAALGLRVSYDFSTRHETTDLAGIEAAFFSLETPVEADALRLAQAARAGGARMAIVTRGQWGSLGLDDEGRLAIPALLITPVDTCGAGDAYIAGFTFAMAGGQALRGAMAAATEAAAPACLHRGGWPQPLQSLRALGI